MFPRQPFDFRNTAHSIPFRFVAGLPLLAAGIPGDAFAATGSGVDMTAISIGLVGGLGLFLYGMTLMTASLKNVAGDRLKKILAKLTTNRFMGVLTGVGVTAAVQSSSATTVMLVGFVTAGLLNLTQAMGVILGADIGTTLTIQIVAFKVTKYAGALIILGLLAIAMGKKETTRELGSLTLGLGLIFFGMSEMSDAMHPLRNHEPFLNLMRGVANPVTGVLVGAMFTGLIQASAATIGIVVVFASQGMVSLEGGIALALGANIGTCMTAGLAALGQPRDAVRVAVAHVMFKIAGVLLLIGFIPEFAALVRWISPAANPELASDPAAMMAAIAPRQIANAHSLFNIGIALVFLPLIDLFVRFCYWLVPESTTQEKSVQVAVPAMALTSKTERAPVKNAPQATPQVTWVGGGRIPQGNVSPGPMMAMPMARMGK
jgi:phosphate:Na+ symporter